MVLTFRFYVHFFGLETELFLLGVLGILCLNYTIGP
jgi:hypothetical protein